MTTAAPAAELRFPDFLCIGAQKAGTSWLHANLRRHPGVWMPWIKELQYFNDVHLPGHRGWTARHRTTHADAAARRLVREAGEGPLDLAALHRITSIAIEPLSDEWYGGIFAHAQPDQICGEVTPAYGLLPRAGIEHVRRLNPRMKVILLLRDPVARCWSQLRMLGRGQEDFDYMAAASQPEVLARADYPRIVEGWSAVFGRENMLIRKIEDISGDVEGFLRELAGFLGVPWHEALGRNAGVPVFVGPEVSLPGTVAVRLREKLAPIYDRMGGYEAYHA
ncbi:sulfotransferase [Roseomonas eburnea]|uniref:Sulfotransferase n=1 Tax=Neoroseomonas eburnea TaxID=1346889 RepID=A0A9X9X5L5_9PROT|nr:sulfotransferase [Neoroseomonas eburnea]MBR0679001.1 sulfotransferase [Neoroseomonas eburnea]